MQDRDHFCFPHLALLFSSLFTCFLFSSTLSAVTGRCEGLYFFASFSRTHMLSAALIRTADIANAENYHISECGG